MTEPLNSSAYAQSDDSKTENGSAASGAIVAAPFNVEQASIKPGNPKDHTNVNRILNLAFEHALGSIFRAADVSFFADWAQGPAEGAQQHAKSNRATEDFDSKEIVHHPN